VSLPLTVARGSSTVKATVDWQCLIGVVVVSFRFVQLYCTVSIGSVTNCWNKIFQWIKWVDSFSDMVNVLIWFSN
jgi:hypothetical protein